MADIEKNDIALEHREANTSGENSVHHAPHHAPHAEVALHHDAVAPEAVGGLYGEMPKGYYWSKDFIGTLIVSTALFPILGAILTGMTGDLSGPDQRISRMGPTSKYSDSN